MKTERRGGRQGFTLLELLVVIVIIVVVSAATLPVVIPALCMAESRDGADVMSTTCMGVASVPSALMMGILMLVTLCAFNAASIFADFVASDVA